MNSIISNYNIDNSRKLLNFVSTIFSEYFGQKETLAIKALKKRGLTNPEIARELNYSSAKVVDQKVRKFGGEL